MTSTLPSSSCAEVDSEGPVQKDGQGGLPAPDVNAVVRVPRSASQSSMRWSECRALPVSRQPYRVTAVAAADAPADDASTAWKRHSEMSMGSHVKATSVMIGGAPARVALVLGRAQHGGSVDTIIHGSVNKIHVLRAQMRAFTYVLKIIRVLSLKNETPVVLNVSILALV